MMPVKSEPPSPSRTGEGEEAESYDLYTPDTLEANGSSTSPIKVQGHYRKRQSTASSVNPSGKRQCSATSKKQTSQSKAQARGKPRVKTPTLVLGIDFGTSHSGAASAHSGNGRINLMMRWDGSNTDYVKIPSAIKFGPDGDIWGVDAKQLPDALRWFKLLLVNPPDLEEEIRTSVQLQKAQDALKALGKTPVEAISIFLKRMFDHTVEMLKISEGQDTVDTSRFHVVFTIPAIWPDYARRRMQEAIDHAGILEARPIGPTTHEFVSEPEAAALATLAGLDRLSNIKEGETIVVVDCGGGTVDLITYKIIKLNPMTVQEVVTGKGALCGSIFVDERFKDLVIKQITERCGVNSERILDQDLEEIMTRTWEGEIRNQFNGEAKVWTIRLPFRLINTDQLDPNRGHPTFIITSEEVEEVFRPIVEKIESLVNSQIAAAFKKEGNLPKYAILVGGFGCSGYLYEYLMLRCQGVEVLQRRGWEPWSAISRGAVLHGLTKKKFGSPLKVTVKSRIARESLGVVGEELYDEDVHPAEDKSFDHFLRQDVATKVMKWHVVTGDEVPVNHTISIKFTKFLDEVPEKIVTNIYKSLDDQPSNRKNESVTKVAEIAWKVQVDWEALETFENDLGKCFKKLEYTVEMKCSAGGTAFSIYHRGRKQAAKNVSLKFYE